MEIIEITEEQAQRLLIKTEGHFLDFKATPISPAKLTRALAAFCNADGGDLYVGIGETPAGFVWSGFNDQEDANGHIQAFEQVSTFGEDLDGEFLTCPSEAGLVLYVNARKSRFVRTATDGKTFKRVSARNAPVDTDDALMALRRQKGLESLEDETLAIPLTEVTNSLPVLEYLLEVVPTAEPEIYLSRPVPGPRGTSHCGSDVAVRRTPASSPAQSDAGSRSIDTAVRRAAELGSFRIRSRSKGTSTRRFTPRSIRRLTSSPRRPCSILMACEPSHIPRKRFTRSLPMLSFIVTTA